MPGGISPSPGQLTGGAVTETLKKCDVVVKEATYAEPSTEGGIDVERKVSLFFVFINVYTFIISTFKTLFC